MSSKKLYESLWENFTKKATKLTEMKDEYMRLISGATRVAQQNPEVLPFRSMFGDKLRVVIPYPRKNVGSIISLLTIFKFYNPLSNWTESFGVTLRDEKVKVKKQALAIAGGGTYEQEKTVKQFVINHNYKDQQNNRRSRELTVIGALQKMKSFASFTLKNFEKGNFKYKNEYGEERQYGPDEVTSKKEYCNEVISKVDQLIAWWNKNQSKFVDDPQIFDMALQGFHDTGAYEWKNFDPNSEAGGMTDEYSIILSRAPVDVLRMSDHQGIESCHSQPSHYGTGGYFYCAIAEAQNQGGIAYVVKTEDLEDLELNKPEIFEDDERGISGIEPISRVRIRTVKNKKENSIYAVPETRVYGEYLPDLPEVVRDFVIDKQESLYIETDGEGNKQFKFADSVSDLETLGGSYQDHPKIGGNLVVVINKLLKKTGVEPTEEQRKVIKNIEATYTLRYGGDESQYRKYAGDDDDDDNEDEMREAAEDTFNRDLSRAKRNTETFDFSACEFNYEWGDGPSIDFRASVTFNFKTKFLRKEYFDERGDINLELLKNDITYSLIHAEDLDYNFTYPDADIDENDIYIGRINNGDTITYQLWYFEDGLSNDQFESRIDDMLSFENSVGGIDGLSSNFISVLIADGIINEEAADQTTQYRLVYNNFVKWSNSKANHIEEERAQEFSVLPSKKMRSTHPDTLKSGWLLDKIPFSYFAKEERSWDRSRTAEGIKQALNDALSNNFTNVVYDKADMYPRERERAQGRLFQDITPDVGVEEVYKKLNSMGSFRVEVALLPLTDDMITIGSWEGQSGNYTASQVGIFIKPIFTIDLKAQEPSSVLALIDAMYMIDEDPNIVMDIMYDSYKTYVKRASEHSSFARQAGSTNLTESRKRVIKERLKNWYRANKGMR
jgi:hypothetical protein